MEVQWFAMDFEALPAGDLVRSGLDDLRAGRETVESLLVEIGAPRLRRLSIDLPQGGVGSPEKRLYEHLEALDAESAHSRYNALIRRLVSFERAAECATGWTANASTR